MNRVSDGNTLDYREHFQIDGKIGLDSITFDTMDAARQCLSIRNGMTTVTASFVDLPGDPESEWTDDLIAENLVCLRNPTGYDETPARSTRDLNITFEESSCDFTFDFPSDEQDQLFVRKDSFPAECRFQLRQIWGANSNTEFCVGSVRIEARGQTISESR